MLATVFFFLTITITARRVLPRDEKHVLSLRLELEMKLSDFFTRRQTYFVDLLFMLQH